MKTITQEYRNALSQSTTQRKGKILVDGYYYDVFNVEYYADCYDEGNIVGNAISSQLDFDMIYRPKFDTFEYFEGIWTGSDYEYLSMGIFTVFDEKDTNNFCKHITSFDNLIKFNKPYVDSGIYPKTMYELLQEICVQAGVTLNNLSIPNGSFVIENNQFVNNETLKTVLKAICSINGNYAIVKNNGLTLQLKNTTTEEIDKSYHQIVDWKRRTYGINQVIIGMQDVDGEYVLKQDDADIELNGVHKLVINDNPFAYTQEKRQELLNTLYNEVHGFGYIPYELKGEWLPHLEIGDTITIDEVNTIVLRINAKSPNALETVMSAPAIIDSAIEYANNTDDIENRLKNTQAIVDKANQQIQFLVTETEQLGDTVTEIGTKATQGLEKISIEVTTLNNKVDSANEDFEQRIDTLENTPAKGLKTLSVVIDDNGLNVSTNISKISSLMANNKFVIKDNSDTELTFIGYDENLGRSVSRMDNLTVTNYLNAGHHRQQEFKINGENRTGWFYIGGE